MSTYRVTVRGRFGTMAESARAHLERHVDEHDIFESAYTAEGTFTYDRRIDFFNLRYEVNVDADSESAGERGRLEAESFLAIMGFTHRGLKVTVVDMAEVWRDE